MTNRFIHHPTIQNDRQRGGDSAVGVVAAAGGTGGTGGTGGAAAAANVHDKEQFPSLSSAAASSSVAPVATKLNFKEMVLKNAAAAAGATETSSSASANASTVVRDVPKVRTEYSRTPLSSGNIFLGAFYGSRNDGGDGDGGDGDGGDGDGGDGDLGGGGGGGFISSTLIDSCDRKYDNLYR